MYRVDRVDEGSSQFGLARIRTPKTRLAVWTLVSLNTLTATAFALASAVAHGVVEGLTLLLRHLALAGWALVAFVAFTNATAAFSISYGWAERRLCEPAFNHTQTSFLGVMRAGVTT